MTYTQTCENTPDGPMVGPSSTIKPTTRRGNVNEENRECQQRQTTIGEFAKRPITEHRKKTITSLLINFIAKDIRPFADVSGDDLSDIVTFFEPGHVIPLHAMLWNHLTLQMINCKPN